MPGCLRGLNHDISTLWNYGAQGRSLSLTSSTTEQAYVIFPELQHAANDLEITFFARTDNPGASFYTGILSDPSDISTLDPTRLDTLPDENWHEIRFNTASYWDNTQTSAAVAMLMTSGFDHTIYIDRLSIHAIPTCTRPENPALVSVADRNAVISWSGTNASQVAVMLASGADTARILAGSSPYTLTGLEPNTYYSAQLRGICSATDSSELNPYPITFKTHCSTASTPLFTEDFDALVTTGSLPYCWNVAWVDKPAGNTTAHPFTTTTAYKHSGARAMSFVRQAAGSRALISSEPLPIDSANKYMVRLWVYRQNAASNPAERLNIRVGSAPDDTVGSTLLASISRHYGAAPVESAQGWYEYEYPIPVTGTQYIIVEGVADNGGDIIFDDLAVTPAPRCVRPRDVVFGEPQATSVDITWTPAGTETSWQISATAVNAAGATVVDTTAIVTEPAFTLAGLVTAQTYAVTGSIVALCSATEQSDARTFNNNITTACTIITDFPYHEDFEGSSFPELCTTIGNIGTGTELWGRTNESQYVASGSNAAKCYYARQGSEPTITLPPMSFASGTSYEVRFAMYRGDDCAQRADETVNVYAVTAPEDTTGAILLGTVAQSIANTPIEQRAGIYYYTFALPAEAAGVRHIMFSFHSQYCSMVYIDDVAVRHAADCGDIHGGCRVSEVTNSSARVSIEDPSVTDWQLTITPETGSATTINVSGRADTLVTGLTGNTAYSVTVARLCGSSTGDVSAAARFATMCDPLTVPYFDDFEDAATDDYLAGCYTQRASSNYQLKPFAQTASATGNNVYNHTTAGSVGLALTYNPSSSFASGTTGTNMVYQLFHLEAGRNYEISIFAKKATYNGYTYNITFMLGQAANTMNAISSELTVDHTDFLRKQAYFTVQSTGDYYLGFNINAESFHYIFLDDYQVREVNCMPPTQSSVMGLGSNTATITYLGTAERYELSVSANPIDIYAGAVASDVYHNDSLAGAPATIVGLTPNTDYYYTLRGICSGTPSDWMNPATFRTYCSSFTVPYVESFDAATPIRCWNRMGTTGSVDYNTGDHYHGAGSMKLTAVTALSPEIIVPAGSLSTLTINGWLRSSTAGAQLEVGVISDPDDVSTFVSYDTVTILQANTWQEFSMNLAGLADAEFDGMDTAHYVTFGSGTATISVDELIIETTPTCPKPERIAASIGAVGPRFATIDWNETGSAAQWRVRAESAIDTVVAMATAHPYTISGLMPATDYSFSVQALCSATDSSRFTDLGSAKTECDYEQPGWSEDFEAMTINRTPECWDISTSSTTSATTNPDRVWGVYKTGGQNMLRLYNYFVSAGTADINTPYFVLAPGRSYRLMFDYCHQASCSDLAVCVQRFGSSTLDTLTMLVVNGTGNSTTIPSRWDRVTVPVIGFGGDTVRLRVTTTASMGSGSAFLDNFAFDELLSCSDISGLSITAVGPTEASFLLADTAAAHTAWQYAVTTAGLDPETAQKHIVNSKQFTVAGLTARTDYQLNVRAYCGPNDTSHWSTLAFTTTTEPAALPYVCRFDDTQDNSLWTRQSTGANNFVIGQDSAAVLSGPNALYVSADGAAYGYINNNVSMATADRVIEFGSDEYTLSFDWQCSGGYSNYHFARAYLVPAYMAYEPRCASMPASSNYTQYQWPDSLIALDGGSYVNLTYGHQHSSTTLNMVGRAGLYRLVFAWINSSSTSGRQNPLAVDNIDIRSTACRAVENVRIPQGSITATTADVRFLNTDGDAISYAVCTSPVLDDSVASGVTRGQSIALTGLVPGTDYTLMLRRDCSDTEHSAWAGYEFSTVCATVTELPLVEDFERPDFPALCWTETTVAEGTSYSGVMEGHWNRTVGTNAHGNASICMNQGSGAAATIATPAIMFDAAREYHVSFYRTIGNQSTQTYDAYNVYVSPTPTKSGARLAGSATAYESGTPISGLIKADIDLPLGLDGAYYIVIEGELGTDSKNNNLYIDDITVAEYPDCRELTSLPKVEAVTATTATVSVQMGRQSAVQFGVAPHTVTVSTADITATALSTTGRAIFTGLTPATQYDFFARAICAATGDTTAWTLSGRGATKADDCFAPEGMRVVGAVNDTLAVICWNDIPNAATCIYTLSSATDTVVLAGLTPSTAYTLAVRGLCGADTTAETLFAFRTTAVPAVLPFSTGFENSADNSVWQCITSSQVNNFVFGTDAEGRNTGSRGLYISSDGSSYSQSLPEDATTAYTSIYNVSYVTRTIYFSEAGTYDVGFDWRCSPFATDYHSWLTALGRSFLAPADAQLSADQATYVDGLLPAGAIPLIGNMSTSSAWSRYDDMVTIDSPCYMNLVFMYAMVNQYGYADASWLSDRPLAVDNVSVQRVECAPVNTIDLDLVTDTAARIVVWTTDNAAVEYGYSTDASADSIANTVTLPAAESDTILLTGLAPSTTYYLFARQACDSAHRSSWRRLGFETTVTPGSMPYICSFEDQAENVSWQTIGSGNSFVVGTDVSNGGARSLYVSNDGEHNAYDFGGGSGAICAQRTLFLSEGTYSYSFDWMSNGEAPDRDYGRVFMAPVGKTPTLSSPVPQSSILLDGGQKMCGATSWRTREGQFVIERAGSYNLTFVWVKNYSSGNNPPLAVDNIQIMPLACSEPQVVIPEESIELNSITAIFAPQIDGGDIAWSVSPAGSAANVLMADTIIYTGQPDTVVITGLVPASGYLLTARSLCVDGAESAVRQEAFSTVCGLVTDYPYNESFENMDEGRNTVTGSCWMVGSSASTAYSEVTSNNPLYGSRSLMLTNYNGVAADRLTVALPEMDSIAALRFTFDYVNSSTFGAETFEVGYLTQSKNTGSFVSLNTLTTASSTTRYEVDLSRVPSTARRLAFRYTGAGSLMIDNVHAARMTAAPATYDTICFNTAFTDRGFNVQPVNIVEGNNTFNRTTTAVMPGEKDTVYTAHVVMRSEIRSTENDTVCAGEGYNRGLWNIAPADVATGRYFHVFRGASATGCDSTVELFLYVQPAMTFEYDTICQGDSYLFGDTTLTTSGYYTRTDTTSRGCSVTRSLNLYVVPDTVINAVTVCQSALPYEWNGRSLNASGVYYGAMPGLRGCTQTEQLVLTVVPADSTINVSICQGGQSLVVDTVITSAGNYDLVRVGAGGCDIVYHIYAVVTAPDTTFLVDDACEGHPYSAYGFNGLNLTADTVLTAYTRTAEMCDSVTVINVTFHATEHTQISAAINAGESYSWNDNDYTDAGVYTVTFSNRFGCDSVVTLTLDVINGVDNAVDEGRIRVVPNPVPQGGAALLFTHATGEAARVEIINAYGAVVDAFEPHSTPVDVRAPQTAGVYYVRLTTREGRVYIEKLIVE